MPESILFLTNAEHRQANVILATASEIAWTSAYHVHIASYAELAPRISTINKTIRPPSAKITFHCLPGKSMEAVVAQKYRAGTRVMIHPPTLAGTTKCSRVWGQVSLGAGPEHYLAIYKAIQGIIRELAPAAVVIDAIFIAGHDAARGLGLRYITMDPIDAQASIGFIICKSFLDYPMAGLGSQFPLSFIDRIRNYVFLVAMLATMWLSSFTQSPLLRMRKSAGIYHKIPSLPTYRSEDLYLCPHIPETTFPGATTLPANVIGLPPIIPRPSSPTASQDMALLTWLQRASTVIINFGSSDAVPNTQVIAALIEGIHLLCTSLQDIQVLWKTKPYWSKDARSSEIVDRLVESGRVKHTPWLALEPSQLLESGRVACYVHHGGANSFFEACRSGIPQLIIPVWMDTFIYAERARFLGFGLIGNTGVAPSLDAAEFVERLLHIVTDESIRTKAAEIGRVCREMGEGRQVAAEAIVEWTRRSGEYGGCNV